MTRVSTGSRSFASVLTFTLVLLALSASPARADITAFIGMTPTPQRHTLKGASAGAGLVIIGFEVEFAHIGEDTLAELPGLQTYSGNVLIQTPIPVMGAQFYGTAGAEAYRETLGDIQETHVGTNIGGGAKIKLIGPIRIRLDYRIIKLQGTPIHNVYQRFYVGGNLKF